MPAALSASKLYLLASILSQLPATWSVILPHPNCPGVPFTPHLVYTHTFPRNTVNFIRLLTHEPFFVDLPVLIHEKIEATFPILSGLRKFPAEFPSWPVPAGPLGRIYSYIVIRELHCYEAAEELSTALVQAEEDFAAEPSNDPASPQEAPQELPESRTRFWSIDTGVIRALLGTLDGYIANLQELSSVVWKEYPSEELEAVMEERNDWGRIYQGLNMFLKVLMLVQKELRTSRDLTSPQLVELLERAKNSL
ncbi:hypothetical protein ABW19_dt0200305 [Dactylella cylindrospora]|nr:hypothetical protein ABW19_dt0200305 [Dactylella cylindrospora]